MYFIRRHKQLSQDVAIGLGVVGLVSISRFTIEGVFTGVLIVLLAGGLFYLKEKL